jgi:hypothetical protein
VILKSEAIEGASFSFYIVLGTGLRLDLRKLMFEDRPYGVVSSRNKKKAPRPQILDTLIGRKFACA